MYRPQIPAEIRRRILFESGHRCSIPTCKYPDVELHHIVAWEKCFKHEYKNLIALCPNCHRLAHTAKIDRKSLRLYKKNLSANIQDPTLFDDLVWIPQSISESYGEEEVNEITLWYPILNESKSPSYKDVNALIKSQMLNLLIDRRAHLFLKDFNNEGDLFVFSESLLCDFKVMSCSKDIVSIKFDISTYSTGAAHPLHFAVTRNFLLKPLIELHIKNLFLENLIPTKLVDLVRTDLIKQNKMRGVPIDKDWINSGTDSQTGFDAFSLTKDNLFLFFNEYSVGPYSEGQYTVKIKLSKIADLLSPSLKNYLK